jgi:hypothetical protein
MANDFRYSVLSPESGIRRSTGELPPGIGETVASALVFARRLDTLENKTVYLVDIGFGGGYNFMVQLEKWFNNNMPSVKTIVRRKPGRVFADESKELWDEVKEKGHAVVLGVAG